MEGELWEMEEKMEEMDQNSKKKKKKVRNLCLDQKDLTVRQQKSKYCAIDSSGGGEKRQ